MDSAEKHLLGTVILTECIEKMKSGRADNWQVDNSENQEQELGTSFLEIIKYPLGQDAAKDDCRSYGENVKVGEGVAVKRNGK